MYVTAWPGPVVKHYYVCLGVVSLDVAGVDPRSSRACSPSGTVTAAVAELLKPRASEPGGRRFSDSPSHVT